MFFKIQIEIKMKQPDRTQMEQIVSVISVQYNINDDMNQSRLENLSEHSDSKLSSFFKILLLIFFLIFLLSAILVQVLVLTLFILS